MVARATPRPGQAYSEEGRAAARTVLTMTAAIGGMVTLIDLAVGSLPVVAVPALALVAGLVGVRVAGWTSTFTAVAGWAGAAVWLVLVPTAQGEAILVPLVMIVVCAAVAIGPGRLLAWAVADAAGRDAAHDAADEEAAESDAAGWIEEI